MRKRLVILSLLAILAHDTLGAQALADLRIGVRLRVKTTGGAQIEGDMASLSADTLRLQVQTRGLSTAIPLDLVHSYAVSTGVSHAKGALRGFLISGSIGLAASVVAIISDRNTDEDVIIGSSIYIVPASVAFTAVGTTIGALIGKRRWQAAQLPAVRTRPR